jgi:ubiquinone/menaquinone biosynthesis C-methylase UbiE
VKGPEARAEQILRAAAEGTATVDGDQLFQALVEYVTSVQRPDSEILGPYIASHQDVVKRMLELAGVQAGEMVYDLGCGDGRVVITAAQEFGAKGVGIEIEESLARSAAERAASLGLSSVQIIHGNALDADLSSADVVILYQITSSNARLRPQLERTLRPGARVVSYQFEVPGWQPMREETLSVGNAIHTLYLYQVPPGITP